MSKQDRKNIQLQDALTLHRRGDNDEAKVICEQILNLENHDVDAMYLLGVIAYEQKDHKLAINLIAKAIGIFPNNPNFFFHLGLAYQDSGDLEAAIKSYDKAIAIKSDFAVAYFNRGNVQRELKQFGAAITSYDRALAIQPNLSDAYLNRASLLLDLNQLAAALQSYGKAIDLKPELIDDYFNFANSLLIQNKNEIAIAFYDKVTAIQPDYIEAYINKANALHGLRQYEAAIQTYDVAIAIKPDLVSAHFNRGSALMSLKKIEDAIVSYDNAIAIDSELADAYFNKGLGLHELKQFESAIISYNKAIAIRSNFVQAFNNLGNLYLEQKKFKEAIQVYNKAIEIDANYADAYSNRGNAQQEQKQFDEAIASYDKAISIKADFALAYSNRGNALREVGQLKESKESYSKALEIDPDYFLARWAQAFLSIPSILSEVDNLDDIRGQLTEDLKKLDEWFTLDRMNYAFEVVGSVQPFHLAYQELNNKKILSQYGHLCNRLMTHWQQSNNIQCNRINEFGKIKIGIVGQQIHNHSVWNAITKGWLLNLDPSKFELHIFYLGNVNDKETKLAESRATSFCQNETSWVNAIVDKKIEVLIYPELGMDPTTAKLANLRLVPIQIATWGHPETTGIPTIDYYLSAELFETEDSQNSYSETLVKLPNLGCYYSRLDINEMEPNLIKLGIDQTGPILICPGAPFKYAPQHDWIFLEICRRLGRCTLVFFDQQRNWTSLLKERLRGMFNSAGLNFDDFVIFIPFMKKDEFYGLMNRADVYLDTIGFSGFNTAMEAIDCALPIVTREGRFMRGRLASGILRRMGLTDLIADSDEEYIKRAVQLVKDKKYHEQIRQGIIKARDILYNDEESIRALEKFLISKCRKID